MTVNDAEYRVIRLLGKGKGGYSYLVTDGTAQYVLIPKPVKKLEKLFIAPKVSQVLYGTSQRALARCACAQRTGFLIKFFNQESV